MNALYFSDMLDETIQCALCPKACKISPDRKGLCRVRENKNGKAAIPYYGFVTSAAVDPIEKKPLYHYHPGTNIFSIGFHGCNLFCPFCQNFSISQSTQSPYTRFSPREIMDMARKAGLKQVAYTYSEPLVHTEFITDCMELAKKSGIDNVLVTNGCINEKPAEDILALTSAVNVDLKCYSEKKYAEILGGSLSAVTHFIKKAWEKNVHIEITTLVVTNFNDNEEELTQCGEFIRDISPQIPWHLSAYHPAYKWTELPTNPAFLHDIAEKAREDLSYVYVGNIAGAKNDTYCRYCKGLLVSRKNYTVNATSLLLQGENYVCAHCGNTAYFR